MRQTEIAFKKGSNCQTSESMNFCIREYVSAIRESDPEKCWPFESVCDFKNLKVSEDTIAPELPQVEISNGKEVESEAPTAFELEVFKGNKNASENATAFELECPKGNKNQSENATAFKFDLNKGNDSDYETDIATEIITSKEMNDEIISDGATELVNLSESENEESVNGGTKTEIIVIKDDANSGKTSKQQKKRKFCVLSELLRDLAGPNIESTVVRFADKVDENTDKSDEDFTIDDEDDSDDDTLGMFLRKRKAVKITCRSNGSRNHYYNTKKKKTRAPKPSNRGPKRAHPHHNFATRMLAAVAYQAELALYDRRGGTTQSVVGQPVAGVGGSKDPGLVVDTPRVWVCKINRNPADFTSPGPGNKYMIRRF